MGVTALKRPRNVFYEITVRMTIEPFKNVFTESFYPVIYLRCIKKCEKNSSVDKLKNDGPHLSLVSTLPSQNIKPDP